MIALLLAAATPQTAVDAERAFAANAQTLGQWTAFRKWAREDAVMFWPQPVNALAKIRDLPDPPQPVRWSPAESYVSCDGSMAANTGPTLWPQGATGYFTTIWVRGATGAWRWTVDHGDTPPTARWRLGVATRVRKAACGTKPEPAPEISFRCAPQASGRGGSKDGTLTYHWYIPCGGGSRSLYVWLWTGTDWAAVIRDHVTARSIP